METSDHAVITPQPVATEYGVRMVKMEDGSNQVQLVTNTPVGTFAFFLDVESAENVGQGLLKAALHARTGLEVTNRMPSNPNGVQLRSVD